MRFVMENQILNNWCTLFKEKVWIYIFLNILNDNMDVWTSHIILIWIIKIWVFIVFLSKISFQII
jgi:hypothetical protein